MKTITTTVREYDEVGRVIKEVVTKEEVGYTPVYEPYWRWQPECGSSGTAGTIAPKNCFVCSADSMKVGDMEFIK